MFSKRSTHFFHQRIPQMKHGLYIYEESQLIQTEDNPIVICYKPKINIPR